MFHKKHLFDSKLLVGAKPRMLRSEMEWFCVSGLTREKVSIARKATKYVHEVFGVQVSEATICKGLCKAGLQSHMKEKKPHLLRKNVVDCLAFAKEFE